MAATFLPYTTDLILALGWAILHSLWQAFFVYTCLRVVLKLSPNASASTRYNLSFLSLAGIFGWFMVTLYQQLLAVKQMHIKLDLAAAGQPVAPAGGLPAVYHSQEELTWIFPNLEMCFPILVGLYVAGVAVMSIKLVADVVQLHHMRKKHVSAIDEAWDHYLQKLARQLRVPRRVKLLVSQHIQVPVMIGFLKPIILLPVAMFNNLSAEQLEAILLHELAHIKRNDYILNIFQSIVETILFFNPFIWWISKNIRLEREHCCDDMVVAHTVQPLHYAKALVALEEYRLTTNPLAMAAADNKQHLFYRIKRIMEMKTSHLNYSQRLLAVLIIAASLTAIAWITPPAQQDKAPQPAAQPAPAPAKAAPADTVPAKEKQDVRRYEDLTPEERKHVDEGLKAAKEGVKAAQEALKNIDYNKINQDVQAAMKNINWQEINENVQTAMKNVNWEQVNQEVQQSMKNVDWNAMNEDIKNAMKDVQANVDPELISKSVQLGLESAKTALSSVQLQKIIEQSFEQAWDGMQDGKAALDRSMKERQKELEKSKAQREKALEDMKKDLEKARAERHEAMKSVEKDMARAKVERKEALKAIEKDMAQARAERQEALKEAQRAREEARNAEIAARNAERQAHTAQAEMVPYKELIQQMKSDKLIDAEKPYTIEKNGNDLYINGVKQSSSVLDKYRKYLNANKVSIKGEKDSLSVNAQD